MTRSVRERLEDIRRACDACGELVSRGESVVFADTALMDALTYRLIVIGEAVGALRRDFTSITELAPNLPWREFVGLRDIVVHQYFRVSPQIVWATARDEIPELRSFVDHALSSLSNSAD